MSLEEEKTNQNEGVRGLLNEDHKAELGKILAFGEKYKKEGEMMKKEFWKKGSWVKHVNLIMQYKDRKKEYMENLTEEEKEILDRLNGVWKDKFIEEYMHNKVLYSGDEGKKIEKKRYFYEEWKAGKVIMEEGINLNLAEKNIGDKGAKAISKMELKEGVILNLTENNIGTAGAEAISKIELEKCVSLYLGKNNIGDEGAKAISRMKLKEGVRLNLYHNNIGAEGAEAISKMELKEGVYLGLGGNNIGDEGAKAISKMELKEGVTLDLARNKIGDVGAEAILKMELKEGVFLDLHGNNISREMEDKLRKWAQGYKDNGINCGVQI